jgi:hypothetical protein
MAGSTKTGLIMIRQNTWILLVVLAALVGFSYYLTNQKIKQAAQATPTTSTATLFSSSDGSPIDIKISDNIGNTFEVVRSASGAWAVKAPIVTSADQGFAEAAASQISAITVIGNVQLGPDIVGLDKPSYVINLTFSSNKTHKLTVGSVTPVQNGYYVQLDGSQIQIADKQGLDAVIGLLNNPPYAATLTPVASATSTVIPESPTPASTDIPLPTPAIGTSTSTP